MFFFFFNDTATTEIYTLSLHDALPICGGEFGVRGHVTAYDIKTGQQARRAYSMGPHEEGLRSEEHTSELQSQSNLVCRPLLEKKKKTARIQPVSALSKPCQRRLFSTSH